ncbi:MAG: hypothetical protein O4861_15920 [Trichodesmium sp. St16_bin4-tuft]|nr:hypothetical protein [Trichodesmium sp. MAG_R01]MDE5072492.1 hypothetical protein [Trichodesmium sp. St5_bin8]MDE5077074.1 hypothetical protein [Trichodesmium sp. St2_bin6]MDE5099738.1 hypothetical protein [Trichodesmium sp. St16_bin4-tuft]MDE5102394.1 hypothetical protein [Trichodesmium sp. St19_bin2]
MFQTKALNDIERKAYLCDPQFDKWSTIQEMILPLDNIDPNRRTITYYLDKLVKARTQK